MTLAPAAHPLRCRRYPECAFPDGGRCARAAEFADPERECVELDRGGEASAEDTRPTTVPAAAPEPMPGATVDDPAATLPWSGRHLTVNEAWGLTALAPVRMVALAGPYDAGKTSLLASLFLQVANGRTPGLHYRFAGCRTLHGFDRLTRQAAGYSGRPGEVIVDHTPTSQSDDPSSFLHLALVPADGVDDRVREVLLSDVPGEWFTGWSEVDDASGRARLPFLSRCDAVLVLADAAKLTGPSSASYDASISAVLGRFQTYARECGEFGRIWVVYTKLDLVPDGSMSRSADENSRDAWGGLGRRSRRIWSAIEDLRGDGVSVSVRGVSAFPGALAEGQPFGVTELFGDVLQSLENPAVAVRLNVAPAGAEPFLWMRREHP